MFRVFEYSRMTLSDLPDVDTDSRTSFTHELVKYLLLELRKALTELGMHFFVFFESLKSFILTALLCHSVGEICVL